MTTYVAPLTERGFQRQVTDLAELLGWLYMHIRAGRTADSWRTPISGPLGKGFPDLVLAHPVQRRLLFVEIKRDGAKLSPDQERVLSLLRETGGEVHVFRPADWDRIERLLR